MNNDTFLRTIMDNLSNMTDEERRVIFAEIKSNFCLACGNSVLPCYCENDE